jgi:hypothetical protein
MELAGAEKRIQALYSELALADRSRMPRFERVWTRAEAMSPAPVFKRALVLTTALVVIAGAFSSALWSRYNSQIALNIAPVEIATAPLPQPGQLSRASQPSRHRRTLRQRPVANPDITQAELLSSWQSPTQSFLESPSSTAFNSLPQLNQSAKDLESFLPKK